MSELQLPIVLTTERLRDALPRLMACLQLWIIRGKQELDYYANNYGAETARRLRMISVDPFPRLVNY
jgi:hypothetical protein